MGTSTNAYLYYGFDFYDPDEHEENEVVHGEESWDDLYMTKIGKGNDSRLYEDELYKRPANDPERMAEEKKRDAYWERKKEEIQKLGGIMIDSHCHHEHSVYFVCAEFVSASRGNPVEVPDPLPTPDKDKIERMREFCKIMGIEWQEPSWRLASYWG